MKKTLKFSGVDQNQFFTNFENEDLNADKLILKFSEYLTESNANRITKWICAVYGYKYFTLHFKSAKLEK
jgi:hypothetical protein